jgi:quercetin dioxygenase-like cupin family protein
MLKKLVAAASLAALAGCVSVDVHDVTAGDVTLAGIQNAQRRDCPAARAQANPQRMEGASTGVEGVDLAFSPLASDPTRALRLRRITIQPGGVIPWHAHDVNQGMAILVSGEMTEYRNDCLDPIIHRAGDIAREDLATQHGWRNLSGRVAVVLVSHVVARPAQ